MSMVSPVTNQFKRLIFYNSNPGECLNRYNETLVPVRTNVLKLICVGTTLIKDTVMV